MYEEPLVRHSYVLDLHQDSYIFSEALIVFLLIV